jgi:hypothetical protein
MSEGRVEPRSARSSSSEPESAQRREASNPPAWARSPCRSSRSRAIRQSWRQPPDKPTSTPAASWRPRPPTASRGADREGPGAARADQAVADLGLRSGDGPAQALHRRPRRPGLLLRPQDSLATRHERDQRAAAPIPPARHEPARFTQEQLDEIAASLNGRPRKTLGAGCHAGRPLRRAIDVPVGIETDKNLIVVALPAVQQRQRLRAFAGTAPHHASLETLQVRQRAPSPQQAPRRRLSLVGLRDAHEVTRRTRALAPCAMRHSPHVTKPPVPQAVPRLTCPRRTPESGWQCGGRIG